MTGASSGSTPSRASARGATASGCRRRTTPTGLPLVTVFAVHFLTADDLEVAERFGTQTGDEVDKFADLDIRMERGVPVLINCPNHLIVRKVAVLDEGGDHVCVTTEPVAAATSGPFQPLRLADVEHLTPGHEAEDDIG